MKNLIEQIYKKIIYYDTEFVEAGKRIDEDVTKLIEPYVDKLNAEEIEELQNIIYTACYTAEFEGFVLGVKTAVKTLLSMLLN